MTNAILSGSGQPSAPVLAGTKLVVAVVLAGWLALIMILGGARAFVSPPGTLPVPIAIGVTAPVVLFLAAFWLSRRFRELVLTADVRVMLGIQAWRFAGLGFLALNAYGVLPGLFAWPAGLGDMAIGLTAPLVISALRRQPSFAAGRLFQVWNLLGILDLIDAVSLGAMCAVSGIGISAEVPTFPMGGLPLVLVPTFLVPLFAILHLTALLQARRTVVAGRVCVWRATTICEPVGAIHRV